MSIPYGNIEKEIEDFLDRVDDGHFTAKFIAIMALKWMSNADFAEMLDANEISRRFYTEEEDSE